MKSSADAFVWEYLTLKLIDPPDHVAERDRETEDLLQRAGAIEYVLTHLLDDEMIQDLFTDHGVPTQSEQEMLGYVVSLRRVPGKLNAPCPEWLKSVIRLQVGSALGLGNWNGSQVSAPLLTTWHLWWNEDNEEHRNSRAKDILSDLKRSIEILSSKLRPELDKVRSKGTLENITSLRRHPELGDVHFPTPDSPPKSETILRWLATENREVILPAFATGSGYWYKEFCFWPYGNQSPLLNQRFLPHPADKNQIAILTPSLRVAHLNQLKLMARGQFGITWLAWNTDATGDNLSNVDWEPLVDRQKNLHMYFLIRSRDEYKIAVKMRDHLAELGVDKLRFASLVPRGTVLDSHLYGACNDPLILDSKDLDELLGVNPSQSPTPQPVLKNYMSELKAHKRGIRKPLLAPLVYERTAALIYGPGEHKEWLALSMAHSIAYAKNPIEWWTAKESNKVLYIHAGPADDLLEKVETVAKESGHGSPKAIKWTGTFQRKRYLYQLGENLYFGSLQGATVNLTSHEELKQLHEQLVEAVDGVSLVVLDGYFPSLSHMVSRPFEVDSFAWWMRRLKAENIALIFVPDGTLVSKRGASALGRRLSFDTVLRVTNRLLPDASKLGMTVKIQKGFRLGENDPQRLDLTFAPTSSRKMWDITHKPLTTAEQQREVKKLIKMGRTDKGIAKELAMSVPMVKKRLRELRKLHPGDETLRRRDGNKLENERRKLMKALSQGSLKGKAGSK